MTHHNEIDAVHGNSHGTLKSYIIGFILSIILTIIPFTIVAQGMLVGVPLFVTIAILALAQLFVQLVFFLHLSTSSETRWNLLAFIFTAIVVAILVAGSLWIIINLNFNMVS